MKECSQECPGDDHFEALVDAHMLAAEHAKRVQESVQTSEIADPEVRFRVVSEALLRRRRTPR